jgi:hypothetical protein
MADPAPSVMRINSSARAPRDAVKNSTRQAITGVFRKLPEQRDLLFINIINLTAVFAG